MELKPLLRSLSGWVLVLVAFLLPFEAYATAGRYFGLTPLKIALAFSLGLGWIVVLVYRHTVPRAHPLTWAVVLLCGTFLSSALLATEFQANAFKSLLRYLVGLALLTLVYYLTHQLPALKVKLVAALWMGSFVSAVLGLALLSGADWTGEAISLFRPYEYTVGDVKRLGATFEYPNAAANYFVLTLPLVWGWWRLHFSGWRWVLSLLLFALPLAMALNLTYSRGAVTAAAGAFSVAAILAWQRRHLREASGLAAIATVILLLFVTLGLRREMEVKDTVSPASRPGFAAEYELSEDRLQRSPGGVYETDITITNTGYLDWHNTEGSPIVLSYRWFDVGRRQSRQVDEILTPLPPITVPGSSVTVRAAYRTPTIEGYYYLVWDIFQYKDKLPWSTGRKIVPGIAECFVSTAGLDLESMPRTDPYRPAKESARAEVDTQRLSRLVLWGAAVDIVASNPWFGIGGGNFRLVYGRYLGQDSWDTNIHANSLPVEVLVSCGAFGLGAVVLLSVLLARYLWRDVIPSADAPPQVAVIQWGIAVALGGFVLHNLVDYFMEFTPNYAAFWVLLGLSSRRENRIENSNEPTDRTHAESVS